MREETLGKTGSAKATRVSGYVDTPTRKACATCEYLTEGSVCRNKVVQRDPQVPNSRHGLKQINPNDGCCNEWEAQPSLRGSTYGASNEGEPEQMSDADLEALLRAKGMMG